VQRLPLVLRAGQELPVRVAFQPRHAGTHNDVLIVSTMDPYAPELQIELRGEGTK
jgi:hypothetical protein